MTARLENYNETTDLYLEILREAQRIEDKKLVQLIRGRLKEIKKPAWSTNDGCEVILFPRTIAHSRLLPKHVYWPKFQWLHITTFLSAYLMLVLGITLLR
jgi:hypothetical protein